MGTGSWRTRRDPVGRRRPGGPRHRSRPRLPAARAGAVRFLEEVDLRTAGQRARGIIEGLDDAWPGFVYSSPGRPSERSGGFIAIVLSLAALPVAAEIAPAPDRSENVPVAQLRFGPGQAAGHATAPPIWRTGTRGAAIEMAQASASGWVFRACARRRARDVKHRGGGPPQIGHRTLEPPPTPRSLWRTPRALTGSPRLTPHGGGMDALNGVLPQKVGAPGGSFPAKAVGLRGFEPASEAREASILDH